MLRCWLGRRRWHPASACTPCVCDEKVVASHPRAPSLCFVSGDLCCGSDCGGVRPTPSASSSGKGRLVVTDWASEVCFAEAGTFPASVHTLCKRKLQPALFQCVHAKQHLSTSGCTAISHISHAFTSTWRCRTDRCRRRSAGSSVGLCAQHMGSQTKVRG